MSEFGGDQGKTEVADRKKGRSKKKNRYSIGWMIGWVVSIVIVLVCLIGVIGFSLCKKDTVAGEWFMLASLVSDVGAFFFAYKAEGDDDGARNVPIYVVTVVMIVAGAVFVAAGRQVNKPHAEIIGVTAALSGAFLAASTFWERHRDNTRADLDPMARERARRDSLNWRKGQLFYLAALTAVFLIGVLIHNSGEWVTTVISSLVILNQSKDMWKRYVGGDADALPLTGIQDTNQGGDEDPQEQGHDMAASQPNLVEDLIVASAFAAAFGGAIWALACIAGDISVLKGLGLGAAMALMVGCLKFVESPSGRKNNIDETTRDSITTLMMLIFVAQFVVIDFFILFVLKTTATNYDTIITTWITATTVQSIVVVVGVIVNKYFKKK